MEIASRKQQESPCDLILRMWDEEMNRDDATHNISEALGISYKYWAFISDSHRDARWAKWLHKRIEF